MNCPVCEKYRKEEHKLKIPMPTSYTAEDPRNSDHTCRASVIISPSYCDNGHGKLEVETMDCPCGQWGWISMRDLLQQTE